MDKTIWFAVVASGVPNFATADASKKMCIFFVNGARRTIAVVLLRTWLDPITTKYSHDIIFCKNSEITEIDCKFAPKMNIERNKIKIGYLILNAFLSSISIVITTIGPTIQYSLGILTKSKIDITDKTNIIR